MRSKTNKPAPEVIALFEPAAAGDAHYIGNSTTLQMIRGAWPGAKILFWAEPGHAAAVTKGLNTVTIPVYPPYGHNEDRDFLKKALFELRAFLNIRSKKPAMLICLQTTPVTINLVKWLFPKTVRVFYFLHHQDKWLLPGNNEHRIWSPAFWMRRGLTHTRENETNIIWGDNMRQTLAGLFPAVPVESLDLTSPVNPDARLTPLEKPVCFASTSAAAPVRRTGDLFVLEKLLRERNVQGFTLSHIASFTHPLIVQPPDSQVINHGKNGFVAQDVYEKLFHQIHYSLYFYPRDSFQLTSSGALLASLSSYKPVIAIRNAYFQYVFDKMGDIGYLCDSIEEMAGVIQTIVERMDTARYLAQYENIKKGIELFSFPVIEKKLRMILGVS